MPPLIALLVFASSTALSGARVHSETAAARPVAASAEAGVVAADSVYYLVSGSVSCEAFPPIMKSLVRRSDVREFIGSDCEAGEIDMVVEFEFASERELMRWQVQKETRELLALVFRELHPIRLQIRATPRDPSASRCPQNCGGAAAPTRG